jgi:hypothetical protein
MRRIVRVKLRGGGVDRGIQPPERSRLSVNHSTYSGRYVTKERVLPEKYSSSGEKNAK